MLYNFIAAIICVLIEAWRIKRVKGEVVNINKMVTYTIAFFLFGVVLALLGQDNFWLVLLIGLNYMSVRGLLYSPVLNLLRGKVISYESTTTNSILDKIEAKIFGQTLSKVNSFWKTRIFYLSATLLSYFVYKSILN